MEHLTPAGLIFILILLLPPLWSVYKARRGKNIYVRRISGIDAIDYTIGRSVEMGRPLSFTTGLTNVNSLLYACLHTMRYVAEKVARFGTRMFIPSNDPRVLVITEMTLQNAYRSQNRLSRFDPSMLRYLSDEQFAYASGYQGLLHRENVGGAFLFGSFAAESLILAEAGQQIGAMQVAATVSPEQVPFFITTCDYTIIGEELYAAGAYLSEDPVQRGGLRGQDIAKALLLFIIVLGIIEVTYKSVYDSSTTSIFSNFINVTFEDSWFN